MPLELRTPAPEDYDTLGDVLHEAFTTLAERHGFPSDFPTAAMARGLQKLRNGREDVYAVAAYLDGRPAGSNFMTLYDETAGIGPISVSNAAQGHGVGRALMQSALDYAARRGIQRVRLMQDAFNMTSLPLYASMGFEVRQACALMELAADDRVPAPNVRAVEDADLPAIEALGRELYGVSRREEIGIAKRYRSTPLLLERDGEVVAYGADAWHAVARTTADAMTLVHEIARRTDSGHTRYFCPLTLHDFFRESLAAKARVVKVMNLMSLGPYEEPRGVWMPSFLY